MAQNLIDLRRRIQSVKNTQKITRAMKTVSAAKLGRSVAELNKTRPMMEKIQSLFNRVEHTLETKMDSHPLLKEREEGSTIIVVVAADKGLCGAFNPHVIEKAEEHYNNCIDREDDGDNISFITVGNKAFKYFNKRDYSTAKNYPSVMSRLKYHHALDLSRYLQEIYLDPEKGIKKIEFVFTRFLTATKQEVGMRRFLPIELEWEEENGEKGVEESGKVENIDYIFEPSPGEIFASLLPIYINTLVYQILLQSSASEHNARMTAMEMASRNASEMILDLTLTMNKLRQASITNELLEIITATEALKK